MVVYTCHPSYIGGLSRKEDQDLRQDWAKSMRLYLKNKAKKGLECGSSRRASV
jgi:hypothetical protein